MTQPSSDRAPSDKAPSDKAPSDNPIDELGEGMLRDAVQKVRRGELPDEVMDRAVERAKLLTSTMDSVQRAPAEQARRHRSSQLFSVFRKPQMLAALAGGLLLLAATMLMQTAIESRRRMATSNNFRQLGLAVHNYHSRYRNGVDLRGGTELTYQLLGIDGDARQSSDGKMIAHSATLRMVVDELSVAEVGLRTLVKKHGGFVSRSEVSAESGDSRRGQWTVRIPTANREALLAEINELGVMQSRTTNSSDMTDQYVDVQARIATKQELEKRILGLLEKHTGDIKDVITVEEQLARVRQEIETMQGRVKQIESSTSMTNIAISAVETSDYVPVKSPTFFNESTRTFADSAGAVVNLFQSLLLVLIALVPWLPILAAVGYFARKLYRRHVVAEQSVTEY